ncbi:MAG: hypothetical protein MK066_11910 [Crocinitomicaceae bacterium]|nr:hypothetical protein [Crocinitomicaceae bacterium]
MKTLLKGSIPPISILTYNVLSYQNKTGDNKNDAITFTDLALIQDEYTHDQSVENEEYIYTSSLLDNKQSIKINLGKLSLKRDSMYLITNAQQISSKFIMK